MKVDFSDLLLAFEFVSFDGSGVNTAYLCKETGKIYWHSEWGDNFEELPDDLGAPAKYLAIPNKRQLDLGKPLVMKFAVDHLPNDYEKVREMFSRSGAYARFKDLLGHRDAIDRWHAFEKEATERALKEWCELHEIEVS